LSDDKRVKVELLYLSLAEEEEEAWMVHQQQQDYLFNIACAIHNIFN
jgi:hypothetical protein